MSFHKKKEFGSLHKFNMKLLCLSYDPLQWAFISFEMNTVELQWLEHLWNCENMFETGIVRANGC